MLKKITYFILFFFAVLTARPNDLLLKAEVAYAAKDYKKAIENYEQLIKEGYSSDKLFYNLGNAYYRSNQLGKAIYYYEKAKEVNPNDEDIKNNLNIAYSKTVDKIESKENFFVSAVKTNVLSTFSTKAWAYLSITLLALTFLFAYLFIAGYSVLLKRVSFFVSLVTLISFFVVYSLGYSAMKSKEQNNFAVVTSTQSKVFVEPTSTSTSKFSLHEGTKVKILELNADWVLIKLENGNEGWLKTVDVGIF
jgi:tetratricopeptide (TPR) repeat protein